MAKRVRPCKVQKGPNAGATYYVHRRLDWGHHRYTIDAERTGWHNSPKMAREAAEQAGYIYVTNDSGDRYLVHESAA